MDVDIDVDILGIEIDGGMGVDNGTCATSPYLLV